MTDEQLVITWVNNGSFMRFYDPDDFKYWIERNLIRYIPYQLWNLKGKNLYAGSARYNTGRKYLAELVIYDDEDKVVKVLEQKKRDHLFHYRPLA